MIPPKYKHASIYWIPYCSYNCVM